MSDTGWYYVVMYCEAYSDYDDPGWIGPFPTSEEAEADLLRWTKPEPFIVDGPFYADEEMLKGKW